MKKYKSQIKKSHQDQKMESLILQIKVLVSVLILRSYMVVE